MRHKPEGSPRAPSPPRPSPSSEPKVVPLPKSALSFSADFESNFGIYEDLLLLGSCMIEHRRRDIEEKILDFLNVSIDLVRKRKRVLLELNYYQIPLICGLSFCENFDIWNYCAIYSEPDDENSRAVFALVKSAKTFKFAQIEKAFVFKIIVELEERLGFRTVAVNVPQIYQDYTHKDMFIILPLNLSFASGRNEPEIDRGERKKSALLSPQKIERPAQKPREFDPSLYILDPPGIGGRKLFLPRKEDKPVQSPPRKSADDSPSNSSKSIPLKNVVPREDSSFARTKSLAPAKKDSYRDQMNSLISSSQKSRFSSELSVRSSPRSQLVSREIAQASPKSLSSDRGAAAIGNEKQSSKKDEFGRHNESLTNNYRALPIPIISEKQIEDSPGTVSQGRDTPRFQRSPPSLGSEAKDKREDSPQGHSKSKSGDGSSSQSQESIFDKIQEVAARLSTQKGFKSGKLAASQPLQKNVFCQSQSSVSSQSQEIRSSQKECRSFKDTQDFAPGEFTLTIEELNDNLRFRDSQLQSPKESQGSFQAFQSQASVFTLRAKSSPQKSLSKQSAKKSPDQPKPIQILDSQRSSQELVEQVTESEESFKELVTFFANGMMITPSKAAKILLDRFANCESVNANEIINTLIFSTVIEKSN